MMNRKMCRDCGENPLHDGRSSYCDPCKSAHRKEKILRWSDNVCRECGTSIAQRHYLARYCFPCAEERRKRSTIRSWKNSPLRSGHEASRKITKYAVKIGFLPPPTDFDCQDCGKPAECYDHRDYNKPLDVDPVCVSCNSSRGRGIPLILPAANESEVA